MDITNINALSRYGSSPASRAVVTRGHVTEATRNAPAVTRGRQQPAEQVLQGELLQKRRKSSLYETTDLLDSLRTMDQLLRDPATTSTDAAPLRDTRRAIASYMQQSIVPNTPGAAAVAIDYFV